MAQMRTSRPYDDTPDTTEAFDHVTRLPEGAEKDHLRQEIAAAWLPLAHRMASRYRDRGESLEDLRQVAALGLVKAVNRYDPGLGSAFESYAVPTIDGEIKRHFRDYMWSVHVPRRVQELRGRVRAARQEIAHGTGGPSPTVAEVAARAHLTEREAAEGMEALGSFFALSLDAESRASDDGRRHTLIDALGAPDPAIEMVVDREAVKPQLIRLPERERKILYLRFFCGMTQSMIARELGISQMHVSRLISCSCSRIRDVILSDESDHPYSRTDAE